MSRATLVLALVIQVLGCSGGPRSSGGAEPRAGGVSPGLAAKGFVGEAVCRGCHEEQAREHDDSGHGRSAWLQADIPRLVQALGLPTTVRHRPSGFSYHVALEGERLRVAERLMLPGGFELPTVTREAWLTVGSGRLTFTSLWARFPAQGMVELYQLPVTHYTAADRWDMSPGYDRADQMRFDRGISDKCLSCHQGQMQPVAGRPYTFELPLPAGIGCERCHGPGRAHVQAHRSPTPPTRDPMPDLSRLPKALTTDLCNSCHMEGRARILRKGVGSPFDFRPGTPLSDTMLVYGPKDPDPALFTHSSHGERFILSRCYRESGGALGCLDCHPAHGPTPKDPGWYNRVCLRCHTPRSCTREVGSPAEHKGPKDPCTDCHMRWSGTSDIPHVSTVDHWIRKPAPSKPLEEDPASVEAFSRRAGMGELTLLNPPRELPPTERLEAEARAYLEHGRGTHARPALDRARRAAGSLIAIQETPSAWRLMGDIERAASRRAKACAAYERALELGARDQDTFEEVAVCRLRVGNTSAAALAARQGLTVAPGSTRLLNVLGTLQRMEGHLDQSVETFTKAIAMDPYSPELLEGLGQTHLAAGRVDEARRVWQRAFRLNPRITKVLSDLLSLDETQR